MDVRDQTKYIDSFLKYLNNTTIYSTIADAKIGLAPEKGKDDQNEIRFLENLLEELNLVERMGGGDNSTPFGLYTYKLSSTGRKLVYQNISSFDMLWEKDLKEGMEFHSKQIEKNIEKRAKQAEMLLEICIAHNLLPNNSSQIKKYFINWFKQNKTIDLQIKDGDFAIEDGDLQIVPSFEKEDIPQFIAWFNKEKDDFLKFLKKNGVEMPKKEETKKTVINNSGNFILNENSKIDQQFSQKKETTPKVTSWTKAHVIIVCIGVIATTTLVVWKIWSTWN